MVCRQHPSLVKLLLMLLALAAGPGACPGAAPGDGVLIAAAASLRPVLPRLVAAFVAREGAAPRVSYGSSGNLYRQIRQGAPFELFLSADEEYVLTLWRDKRTQDSGAIYAHGRVALMLPAGSVLEADATLADLRAALADGRLRRFAIANPEHAPYGRAAREVLESAQVWTAIQRRLLIGENASQTAQFILAGGVDGGIVPYVFAYAANLARRSRFALLPAAWHASIVQRMVLLAGARDGARALYRFMQSAEAKRILASYGLQADMGESP